MIRTYADVINFARTHRAMVTVMFHPELPQVRLNVQLVKHGVVHDDPTYINISNNHLPIQDVIEQHLCRSCETLKINAGLK